MACTLPPIVGLLQTILTLPTYNECTIIKNLNDKQKKSLADFFSYSHISVPCVYGSSLGTNYMYLCYVGRLEVHQASDPDVATAVPQEGPAQCTQTH